MQVTVAITPNGRADAVHDVATDSTDGHWLPHFVLPLEKQMPMTDFLLHLKQPHFQARPSSKHPDSRFHQSVMYIQQQNGNFTSHFPMLADDVDGDLSWASEAFGAKPDAVNLWIGNEQSVTSFHKDHYENLYAVVTGEKIFTLLPPSDAYRMHLAHYPLAACIETPTGLKVQSVQEDQSIHWCPVEDLSTSPCNLEYQQKFPAYFDPSLPQPIRVTVKAGEVLYLPSLWWH